MSPEPTSPTEFDRDFWEDRYGTAEFTWSGNANEALVAEVAGLAPGTALDIGSGEGGDALWLAARGWSVTGVDISQNALDKAAGRARELGPEIADRTTWEQHDLLNWAPAPRSTDLVSAQFMHLAEPERSRLFLALAEAVSPGGTLLIVGHDLGDLVGGDHADHHRHLMFSVDDVLAAIAPAGLSIVTATTRQRTGTDTNGHLRDVVVRARRSAITA